MLACDVTAIVLTLNEEQHLPDCLKSLTALTSSVLVLDSYSTDRTEEIALRAGAQFEQRGFDGYASQRNAALAMAPDAQWVLFLDADERLTELGTREIRERICGAPEEVCGFWFPRRNMFFGRQIRGGGWWPDYQARLFRKGRARFDESRQVHEVAIVNGGTVYLAEPLIHENYRSRVEFIRKQRAYTLRRVESTRIGQRPRLRSYLSAPARQMYLRYVTLRGYRDGLDGLFLSSVLAIEEVRECWLRRRQS